MGHCVPLPPAACDPRPTAAQVTCYMGEKMAFCPFARLDDGLMDVCAVTAGSRLQLVGVMDAAKAQGRHVLGQPLDPRPLPQVRYTQTRELVLQPVPQESLAAAIASAKASSDPEARAAAMAANPDVRAMIGDRSVNVDGDLCGFSPARLTVCALALPVVTFGLSP